MTETRQPGRRGGLQLLFVCLGVFMAYLDSTIVNVALPDIQRELTVSVTDLQWVVDGYVLTFACFLLTAGTLADRFGRRTVFLAGLAGFALTSVACALSGGIELLLAARAVQGIFGSVMITSSLSLVNGLYEDRAARARALALWGGVGGIALAAGPVLGGALLERFSWASIFWLNAPIGVIAIIALLRLLPAGAGQRPGGHLDLPGQLLFIGGIGALSYALIQASTEGWAAGNIIGGFIAAVAALALFLVREARSARPMLPLGFFRNKILVMACAVNLLSLYGMFGALFLLTIYLQEISGLSPIQTGVRFLGLTASIMIGSPFVPRIAASIGTRAAIALGSAVAGVGLLGLLQIHAGSGFNSYGWWLVAVGLGISLAGVSTTVALLGSVPPERSGLTVGTFQTFRQVGAVLGVALSGTLALQYVRHGLPSALARVPVPAAARDRLITSIGHGQFAALQTVPARLHGLVLGQAGPVVVNGIHIAMVIAAAGAFAGAAVALVLGPRKPAAAPASAVPTAVTSQAP